MPTMSDLLSRGRSQAVKPAAGPPDDLPKEVHGMPFLPNTPTAITSPQLDEVISRLDEVVQHVRLILAVIVAESDPSSVSAAREAVAETHQPDVAQNDGDGDVGSPDRDDGASSSEAGSGNGSGRD